MEGLIAILIMIGAIVLKSSKTKNKANQQASRNQGFREAAQTLNPKPDQPAISMKKWAEYLMQADSPKAEAPKPKPEAPKPKPAKPKVKPPKPAAEKPAADTPLREGSISTQGESEAEHAEHRRKILAEEAKRREEYEAHQELRNLNLKRLRSAIVMREILDKPVALRGPSRR